MTNQVNELTRKTSLRKRLKNASVADLTKIRSHLDDLISEAEEKERAERAKEAEKQQALDEVLAQARRLGLSGKDIAKAATRSTSTVNKRIYEVDGQRIEYAGRGVLPKALKAIKDNGDDIESYRVE
jgi:DNA-binding protein H-NS